MMVNRPTGCEPNYTYQVFDHDKMIKLIKENNIKHASAGIEEDYHTIDVILKNEEPELLNYAHIYSHWGTPIFIDHTNGKTYECWKEGNQNDIIEDIWTEEVLEQYNREVKQV